MTGLYLACTALLAATAAWTTALLLVPGDLNDTSVTLIGLSWWTLGAAAVVGMLVVRGRWARRLGIGVVATHGVVALLVPTSAWWISAVALSGLAAIGLAGPFIDPEIRQRPGAAPIPTRALLIPLILSSTPLAIGVAGTGGWAPLTGGVGALVVAAWFLRAMPGALLVVRLGWPLMALGLGVIAGGWGGSVLALLGMAVAVAAWHRTVATALHPLTKRGSVVPIPPELTPGVVLDAADIDDRGRRR